MKFHVKHALTVLLIFLIFFLISNVFFTVTIGIDDVVRAYSRGFENNLSEFLVNFFSLWKTTLIQRGSGLIPPLLTLGVSMMMAFVLKVKYLEPGDEVEVIRGVKLLSARDANKAFRRVLHNEVGEIIRDSDINKTERPSKKKLIEKMEGKPFTCSNKKNGVSIPEYILDRHMAFLGSTGVGKSTLLKHYIDYCNQNFTNSLIIDLNGEMYAEMGQPDDIILSPFDSRTHKWDFNKEVINGERINPYEFSRYIVPKGSEENSFWWKGARTVLTDMLNIFKNSEDLRDAIIDPERSFRKKLSGTVSNIIGAEGSSQDAGILGTICSDLEFLNKIIDMNEISEEGYFSVANWARKKTKQNLFIVFSDKDLGQILPLVRIWINLAILGRFESGNDNSLPKMNIIVDELASYGHIEQIPHGLARLRKYGGRIVLGYQSGGQLESIYGAEDARAIKNNIGTSFVFRTTDENEATLLSNFLGSSEAISLSKSKSGNGGGEQESVTESSFIRHAVIASEVQSLADGHFFLKSLNIAPSKLRIHKKRWPVINATHSENYLSHPVMKVGSFTQKPLVNINKYEKFEGDKFSKELSEIFS